MALSDELAKRVLDCVYEGMTLKDSLKTCKVSRDAFYKYKNSHPVYADELMRAWSDLAHEEAEEMREIADNIDIDPNRARNMIDVRKWRASRLNPRVYGDRLDLNLTTTVDLTVAMDEARRRALPVRDQQEPEDAQLVETKQLMQPIASDNKSGDLSEIRDAVEKQTPEELKSQK